MALHIYMYVKCSMAVFVINFASFRFRNFRYLRDEMNYVNTIPITVLTIVTSLKMYLNFNSENLKKYSLGFIL